MNASSRPRAGEVSTLRLLIVEDSRDDAELTVITLRDSGLAIDYRRVDTADLIESALRDFDPHLVLSDINIPGFSGQQALALVRRTSADLPFVFLTGSPEGAPLEREADGLVHKDDLSGLPDLIRQLLGV